MPLGVFRIRNIATADTIGVLWATAMFAWFFLSALHLQQVLGYDPLEVGLAYLPTTLIMGAFSLGLSAKLAMRFGTRLPIAIGWVRRTWSAAVRTRPVDGNFAVDVLPE